MAELPEHVSADQLAICFGVTVARVHQLVREEVLPKDGRGKFPTIACIQNFLRYQIDLSEGLGASGDLLSEKTRLTKANADLAEIKAALADGETVLAVEVKETWGKVLGALRAQILAFGSKHSHDLFACQSIDEIKDLLEERTRDLLTHLSESSHASPDS